VPANIFILKEKTTMSIYLYNNKYTGTIYVMAIQTLSKETKNFSNNIFKLLKKLS